MNLIYLYLYLYLVCLVYLLNFFKHVIVFLMFMELLMLMNLSLFNIFLKLNNINYYLLLYFMIFVVCEAVLGLGLMVLIIRMQGVEYMYFFNLSLW